MRGLSWFVSFAVVLFGAAGCGGGGGGGTTPNVAMAGGVNLISTTYSASVLVADSSFDGAAISDAVVTVNGVALTNIPPSKWWYAIVVPDASGNFNFSVTAKGSTYTATESKLDSVPIVSMPANFFATSANPISWTAPGGATGDMIYHLSISLADGTWTEVYTTGWIGATSVNIPVNTTVAGTNYIVSVTAAKPGTPIVNAVSGSNFSVNAYAQQLTFTAH